MPDANLNVHRINNNQLPSPTSGKWIIPVQKGIDGSGIKRYAKYHSYEMSWNLLGLVDFETLMTVWRGHYNSGTAEIRLPPYDFTSGTDWIITGGFINVTGCIVDRPEFDQYDNKNHRGVKMLIRKISI